MATLRILGDEDVRAAIDTDRALDLARKTLQDQAAGRSLLSTPAAMTLDSETLRTLCVASMRSAGKW
jgi:hypothetical protein